jgi:hypothetical protein
MDLKLVLQYGERVKKSLVSIRTVSGPYLIQGMEMIISAFNYEGLKEAQCHTGLFF